MIKRHDIPYVDFGFNPVWGCEPCSMACRRCYVKGIVSQLGVKCFGKGIPRKVFADLYWREPIKWNLDAGAAHVTPTILCGDMCDIFDKEWPDGIRHKLWKLIEDTHRLYWLLLTKRIENAEKMLPKKWMEDGFPMNVGMGVTIEHQQYANKRMELLCKLPVHFRWISAEPLLSDLEINLNELIHWVIIGCDSSKFGPWPTDLNWIKNILRKCKERSILSYVKQISLFTPYTWTEKYGQNVKCSKKKEEWPEDVRVQEIPNFRMIKIGR